MEAFGLAIGVLGLVSLFNSCLESLAKAQSYRSSKPDSHVLNTRFRAARARFEQWGVSVGISQGKLTSDHHPAFDKPETAKVVEDILHIVIKIICDGVDPHRGKAIESFHPNEPQAASSVQSRRTRLRWALGGKEERIEKVEIFEKLVQQLYNLAPPSPKSDEHADRFDGKEWSDDLRQMLSKIEREMQAEVRREVYSWLGKSPASDRYEDSINKRVDNTCNWLFDRPVFKSWLSTGRSSQLNLLWINGPAGFGKTILCAHVIKYLSNLLSTPMAYFFFTSEHESRDNPYLALRSWICQVVSHHDAAFERVHEAWEGDFGEVASRRTLVKLFKTIVDIIPGSIFVADGLDECTNLGNGDGSVAEFLSDIINAVSESDVKLLFVSRDEPEIGNAFVDNLAGCFAEYRIDLEDVRSDTAAFSQSIVDRKLSNKSGEVRSTISEAMTERCQGQFLWLKMQEQSLRKGMSKKRLNEVVENTPSGLDRLYDHNWARIIEMAQWERDRAIALLRWTAFATRPLTVYKITEAVLVTQFEDLDPDEYPDTFDEDYIRTEIVGLCGPLLEIRQPSGTTLTGHRTIHIPHFSVRQYLLHQLPIPRWIQQNGQIQTSYERLHHAVLAKGCLQYVSCLDVWTGEMKKTASPDNLLDYAAKSWFSHVESGFQDPTILELSTELFNGEHPAYNHFAKYIALNVYTKEPEELGLQTPPTPLEYILALGWAEMAISLVDESNANEIGWGKRSPIFLACYAGMTDVVYKLLQVGANLKLVDSSGRTPLHDAAWGGWEDAIKILVENGVHVSAQDVDGLTPLHYASLMGHRGSCEYLIRSGASLTTVTHEGRNPLHFACKAGHPDVVKLIVQNGTHGMVTDAPPTTSSSALHYASMSGSIETVKVLLDHGAKASIVSSDLNGWTPLAIASYYGQVTMTQLFLDHGAEVTIAMPSHSGRTPLHAAAATEADNDELIKLLLRYGAEVTVSMLDDEGCTPLFLASERGHRNVVISLLQHQVQGLEALLRTTNGALATPLLAASQNGHVEVVKELLDYGVGQTITIQDVDGQTPLYAVARRSETELAELLLSHGAGICLGIKDVDGETPLYSASTEGRLDILKLLLEHGAETTMTIGNKNGETPLHSASSRGSVEIVQQLLNHGARSTIETQDIDGLTPLHRASIGGYEEAVQLLLEHGAEVTIPTKDLSAETPLHVAVTRNHLEVVRLLLDSSPAHCNIQDRIGCTALFTASRLGFLEVVELLLSTDSIDLDAMDWNGSSPLFAAVANGHLEVVKLLISRGAIVNSWASVGQSLLWWAQRAGNPILIRLLEQQDTLRDAPTPETWTRYQPLPDDAKPVIFDSSLGWCDVCTLTFHEGQSYGCVDCTHSHLLVCPECYHRGFQLCRERHALVPQ